MLFALVPLEANAQTVTNSYYDTYQGLALIFRADGTYTLQSPPPNKGNVYFSICGGIEDEDGDSIETPKESSPPVIWSAGTYEESRDTVICTDKYLHRKLWLMKQQKSAALGVLKTRGYQYKNDIHNKQRVYVIATNRIESREASTLLEECPYFRLVNRWKVNENGNIVYLEIYSRGKLIHAREVNPPIPINQWHIYY
jgi:hypothetical protein